MTHTTSHCDGMGRWHDLGTVFRVAGQRPWMHSHGYVPTALVLDDRIRVFAAFWDAGQVGRVGYVDLHPQDPGQVLGFSADPVLDVGAPGCFDEHGVTPMSVTWCGDEVRLYYAGWQRGTGVRYLLFTGLAISRDDGASFTRLSDTPVIDRSRGRHLVRTGFVAQGESRWRAWLAESHGLIDNAGKPTPTYRLTYCESEDGIAWPARGTPCFAHDDAEVFGVGRSAIWREDGLFHGMFSLRRRAGYRIEHATSADGATWSACTGGGFSLLPQHTAPRQTETMFPSFVASAGERYVFYNGDNFGRDGIRCARWHADA